MDSFFSDAHTLGGLIPHRSVSTRPLQLNSFRTSRAGQYARYYRDQCVSRRDDLDAREQESRRSKLLCVTPHAFSSSFVHIDPVREHTYRMVPCGPMRHYVSQSLPRLVTEIG